MALLGRLLAVIRGRVWNRAGTSNSFPYPIIHHLVLPLRPPRVWEGLRGGLWYRTA